MARKKIICKEDVLKNNDCGCLSPSPDMTVLISCSAERQSCGMSEPRDNLDPEATLRMPAAVKGWFAQTPCSLQAPSGTTGADCPHPIPVNIASSFDKFVQPVSLWFDQTKTDLFFPFVFFWL